MRLDSLFKSLPFVVVLFVALLLLAGIAHAQTTSSYPPAPLVKLAVNPITNKVYVANELANSVTVLDMANDTSKSISVGPDPQFIAVNPVTNRVYVDNAGDGTLTVIDGATDTNLTPTALALGSVGPISVNPVTNTIYVVRLSGTGRDEVTFVDGASDTWYTIATGSFQPIAMAVNPLTDTIFVIHYATGDVRIISGAYNPNDAFPATTSLGLWSNPVAVVANPVTNKVYAITADARGPVAVIDAAAKTATFPAAASGHAQGPKSIAVNPVTNRVYAAFANEVIVIDGASNALTYVPVDTGSGAAGIAVNTTTNKVYIAADDGTLTILDGATNSTTTQTIPGAASAIGVNPITDKAFVFGSSITVVQGLANPGAPTVPLTASITPLPGNTSASGNVSFTIAASSGFTPNAPTVMGVYWQLDGTNRWTAASGSGPYGASFTGLAPGSHTLRAFAVDGQHAPLANGPQSMPLVGAIASYAFTVGQQTATVSLASSKNPSTAGDNVTFTASVSGSGATATGSVTFSDGTTTLCNAVALSSGSAACATASLATGSHSITAVYSGDTTYKTASSAALTQTVQAPPAARISLAPAALDFGGESMGTTSPPRTVTVTNTGNATLTISGISVSDSQFAQTSNCASVAPGAGCTITVTFAPAPAAGAIDATVAVSATLAIASNSAGGNATASLAGTAEKSLVTHYYEAILRREPDAGGKSYWEGEATHMASLGADVNEVWYAMAMSFFASPEYAGLGRDDSGFVTDLYETFFNRAPDASGLSYWTGQMASGLPRDNVLLSFLFSSEFTSFTQSIFGNTAARAEVDAVFDFYRGYLARLPDDQGFAYWVQRFRTAQCQGAGAVDAQVDAISNAFQEGAEYQGRNRTNAGFVGDLYNAFLRRGGDLSGVRYWIGQLDSAARTRGDERGAFMGTPEFQQRVDAIVGQGCAS